MEAIIKDSDDCPRFLIEYDKDQDFEYFMNFNIYQANSQNKS